MKNTIHIYIHSHSLLYHFILISFLNTFLILLYYLSYLSVKVFSISFNNKQKKMYECEYYYSYSRTFSKGHYFHFILIVLYYNCCLCITYSFSMLNKVVILFKTVWNYDFSILRIQICRKHVYDTDLRKQYQLL